MNNLPDPPATALGALLCFVWGAFLLGWLVHRSRIVSDTVQWFRKSSTPRRIAAVMIVAGLVAFGGSKGGDGDSGDGDQQDNLSHPPLLLQRVELPAAPSITPVSVYTNDVAFRAESTNAVEVAVFRRIGGTELGEWLDADAPFFSIGTNPVSRCYVSASGSISFESMRRPPVGSPLPDGTGLPALCPLRAPLGMVPEANWGIANAQSRFWHDALPGGGRVLTWEDALVDRLPGRRVSLQVELQPSGDSVFRYDFHDALDPPATNFTMGAQMGTNGVNALSILGTNVLSATVWNVEGTPVTNGVSIADLLCTNGVLRTPASFEIRWRNTTGLDPNADTDEDGLTDWSETFLWGTDPNYADTDGDGIADNVELMMGMNPFYADENGDGVPDGMSESEWLANPLWAASDAEANVVITLRTAIPEGGKATLVVGGLTLPLSTPASYPLALVPGECVPFRLLSSHAGVVDLSLDGAPAPRLLLQGPRSPMEPPDLPLWLKDPASVFDGEAEHRNGLLAVPVLHLVDEKGRETETSECVHESDMVVTRYYAFHAEPEEMGLTTEDLSVEEFVVEGPRTLSLTLVGFYPAEVTGTISVMPVKLKRGVLATTRSLHRCRSAADYHECHVCGFPHDSDETCSHAPDCPAVLDPDAACTCNQWVQVAWQDMDEDGVSDGEEACLVPGSPVVDFAAIGSTLDACCCCLETGDGDAVTARLVSHSSNLRLWDESGELLQTGDALETFSIQAKSASPSVGGSEVVYQIVGPSNDVRRTIHVPVTAWDAWCTGMAYNHAVNAHVSDAINLRHGYATNLAINYTLPEWVSTTNHTAVPSRNEPGCWIAGTRPYIRARFEVRPTDITYAVLRADHSGSILSEIPDTYVHFQNGKSLAPSAQTLPDHAYFVPYAPIPNVVSRSTEETWIWQAVSFNGHEIDDGFIAINGPSVAYSILGEPVAPWTDASLSDQNVWTSALDVVCSNGWALGATDLESAMSSITSGINGSGRFAYDVECGAIHYTLKNGRFDLTEGLSRLQGGEGKGSLVNCIDCANFVVSLSNLIGAQLFTSRMGGYNFNTNPYTAIGRPAWTPPLWGPSFSFHAVAWSGECGEEDAVFDACLRYDGDGDPTQEPRIEELPCNVTFSDGNPDTPYMYRERLASPGRFGYERCIPRPEFKQRLPIQ